MPAKTRFYNYNQQRLLKEQTGVVGTSCSKEFEKEAKTIASEILSPSAQNTSRMTAATFRETLKDENNVVKRQTFAASQFCEFHQSNAAKS